MHGCTARARRDASCIGGSTCPFLLGSLTPPSQQAPTWPPQEPIGLPAPTN